MTRQPFLAFSPDSRRLVVVSESGGKQSIAVDGTTIGSYEGISRPTFSPDSSRVAFAAKTGKLWAVVIDGVAQKAYLSASSPVFSPDGTHVAYEAAHAEGSWLVVVDGVEGETYDGLLKGSSIVFSDNGHLSYFAVVSREKVVLVDEEIQGVR